MNRMFDEADIGELEAAIGGRLPVPVKVKTGDMGGFIVVTIEDDSGSHARLMAVRSGARSGYDCSGFADHAVSVLSGWLHA